MVAMMTVTMMHSGICRNDNSSCQHYECDGTKNQIANLHDISPFNSACLLFENRQAVHEAYSPGSHTSNVLSKTSEKLPD